MGHLQVGGGGYIYHRWAPSQGSKSILLKKKTKLFHFGTTIKAKINYLNLGDKYNILLRKTETVVF
jgi:hypothetical protein